MQYCSFKRDQEPKSSSGNWFGKHDSPGQTTDSLDSIGAQQDTVLCDCGMQWECGTCFHRVLVVSWKLGVSSHLALPNQMWWSVMKPRQLPLYRTEEDAPFVQVLIVQNKSFSLATWSTKYLLVLFFFFLFFYPIIIFSCYWSTGCILQAKTT